jgi:hypothetical protein
MTTLLEQALEQVRRLPPDEQDAIAGLILDGLEAERRWQASFAASQDALATLANEALAECRAGRTRPLRSE